jgi:pilus assembly protein TadC
VSAAVLVLVAAALLASGGAPARARFAGLGQAPEITAAPPPPVRPAWIAVGAAAAALLGAVTGGPVSAVVLGAGVLAAGLAVRRKAGRPREGADDLAALAGLWSLLAVCLESGLPVAAAVTATTSRLTGPAGGALRRVAGLLELGADAGDAWSAAADRPALAPFARAACRSAGTGAALAQVARAEGDRLRAELTDTCRARAERAGVLITGPLGLCFLPAFLVLGIAPVVIGLASEALARW